MPTNPFAGQLCHGRCAVSRIYVKSLPQHLCGIAAAAATKLENTAPRRKIWQKSNQIRRRLIGPGRRIGCGVRVVELQGIAVEALLLESHIT